MKVSNAVAAFSAKLPTGHFAMRPKNFPIFRRYFELFAALMRITPVFLECAAGTTNPSCVLSNLWTRRTALSSCVWLNVDICRSCTRVLVVVLCRQPADSAERAFVCFKVLLPLCRPEQKNLGVGKLVKFFYFIFFPASWTRVDGKRGAFFFWLRFGRVDNTGGGGAASNGRGESSQWQLLACGTVRLTSGAANQINKRLISLKGNSSDFNRILITADRCLLVTL